MTPEWKMFLDYIASFNIDPRRINIQTVTVTGYDEWVDAGGRPVPVFRSWPTQMDVPYLFQLGYAAIESEKNEVPS